MSKKEGDPSDLIWAVVERGILDATGNYKLGREDTVLIEQDALEWIRSEATHPFSFEWCCDVLGLAPGAIRSFIRRNKNTKFRASRWDKSGRLDFLRLINDTTPSCSLPDAIELKIA